jgi:hypothetical protein
MSIPDLVRYYSARANEHEDVYLKPERQDSLATPAHFVVGDAFALDRVDGQFDAAFVGFWWSHLLREDVRRFLLGLHRRLPAGSPVMIVDNRYVSGSNWPITRTDVHGNTYQGRRLRNGVEYEVLKNFPTSTELLDTIASTSGSAPRVHQLTYYWYATYHAG